MVSKRKCAEKSAAEDQGAQQASGWSGEMLQQVGVWGQKNVKAPRDR